MRVFASYSRWYWWRAMAACRAADAMHLTQPAVSLQIRTLEEIAGMALTRKVGRNIQLTAAGEVMVEFSERILRLWEQAGDELAALQGVTSGTLRIGAVTTAEHLLPPMLVPFTLERPDVRLKLQVGNRTEIIHAGAARDRTGHHGHAAARTAHQCGQVCAPPDGVCGQPAHPLMKKKNHAQRCDGGQPAGARARLGHAHGGGKAAARGGHAAEFGSEVSSNEAIKRMVAAGLGVGFLSVHACGLEFEAGLLATCRSTWWKRTGTSCT
jgi:DNA-binding transcriptional LysR family regulator